MKNCFQSEDLATKFKCLDFLSKLHQNTSKCLNKENHFNKDPTQFSHMRHNLIFHFNSKNLSLESLEFEILRSPSSYISFVHCFLSLAVGFIIFAISSRCRKPQKIPITIFSKIFYFKMNYDFFKLMKTPLIDRQEKEFVEKKERIETDIEDQQNTDRNDLFNRIKSFN